MTLIHKKIKIKYRIEFAPEIGCEHFVHLNACSAALADSINIIFAESVFSHLVQKFVKSRSVKIILRTLKARKHTEKRISLRQTLCLTDEINYIHSKAVNALVEPPQHHLINALAYFLVFPVQIHLLLCKEMKSPLIKIFIIIPRTAAEQRQPVVRRCDSFVGCITPNIIIVIRIILAFKCFLKPIVLVARMVYNKVNYQLHSSLMNF